MKAFLMHKDRDFDMEQKLPWNEPALTQDLELNTMFNTMAKEDEFIINVVKTAVLTAMNNDKETILYRQAILKDCINNPSIIRVIYDIVLETLESKKKSTWYIFGMKYPDSILHTSLDVMGIFMSMLKKLRDYTGDHSDKFESEGFRGLFAMLKKKLDDEYFARVEAHLKELKFRNGTLISAGLGKGNKGVDLLLRKSSEKRKNWIRSLFEKKPTAFTYSVHPRDVAGSRALAELNGRGINPVSNALAQSVDHIQSFIDTLRAELAFYIGCLNLKDDLAELREPITFPRPEERDHPFHFFQELYDICLALTMNQKVVGNELTADGKNLILITGANQGGKSTFLRSIGLAQLMMQSGMFVPAGSFSANICDSLVTHYKREEDTTMSSGKLDEELKRMSEITDNLSSFPLVLFNESFAATNDREGSEIARQIVSALREKNIKMFFVTHLYEFAHGFFENKIKENMFLRAERESNGSRTFKLIEGEPLQTSYGEDLYNRIFNNS